jgi:hypothetical protein
MNYFLVKLFQYLKMFDRVEVKLFLILSITFTYVILLNSFKLHNKEREYRKIEKSPLYSKISDVDFERLIYRLDKALNFFENNFHSVNVDGLFGIRIAEGLFLKYLSKVSNLVNLTHEFYFFFKEYF